MATPNLNPSIPPDTTIPVHFTPADLADLAKIIVQPADEPLDAAALLAWLNRCKPQADAWRAYRNRIMEERLARPAAVLSFSQSLPANSVTILFDRKQFGELCTLLGIDTDAHYFTPPDGEGLLRTVVEIARDSNCWVAHAAGVKDEQALKLALEVEYKQVNPLVADAMRRQAAGFGS